MYTRCVYVYVYVHFVIHSIVTKLRDEETGTS